MKISLAQLNLAVGNLKANLEKVLEVLEKARKKKVDLTVFSELTLTGYPPRDLLLHPEFILETENILRTSLLPASKGQAFIIGLPWLKELVAKRKTYRLYNALLCINNSRIEKVVFKKCLPNYEVFNESRYFTPAKFDQLEAFSWKFKNKNLLLFVCEDLLGLENNFNFYDFELNLDPISFLKQKLRNFSQIEKNNSLIICSVASPYRVNQIQTRIDLAQKLSLETKIPVCLVNQVGASDDLIFDGSSFILKEKSFFQKANSFQEEILNFSLTNLEKPSFPLKLAPSQTEEIKQALVTGLRDYFQKNSFGTALIGLSGGIDSALVSYLAVKALKAKNLRVILMPSEYSSKESLKDAKQLIKNLRITNSEIISIDQIKDLFLEKTKTAKLTLIEENLQARIRGNLLMTLSNKYNALLLSTSNKSELAVGYTTLYGDLCGAVSPIADLWKTEVLQLARTIPEIPKNILEKPPSAELRPNQTDQDFLLPYRYLDLVLKDLIEHKFTIRELKAKYQDLKLEELKKTVKLVKSSEYKRAQAPIVLKVKRESFSKNNWFYQVSSVNL